MQQFTLNDFKKKFDAASIKKAEKLVVRELEENNGKFICFVDDNADSWDVSIDIDKKGSIIDHACDCDLQEHTFCLHKIAALLKIDAREKNVKKETKKLAKEAPAVLLLKQIEEEPLKVWLKEVLLDNKDLQLAFLHHFSIGTVQYQKGDIAKITKEAIKSVVRGNKKNVEISELKKIVDLLKKIHAPIIEQYIASPTKRANFDLLQELITSCIAFNYEIYTNSNKIPKYIESIIEHIVAHLALLPETDYVKGAGYFLSYFISQKSVDALFLHILEKAFDVAEPNKQKLFTEYLVKQLKTVDTAAFYHGRYFSRMTLHFLTSTGLFKDYASLCKPVAFENNYNIALIKQLMQVGNYALAEKYCIEQVYLNYYQEYNVPYWQILKEIYTVKGIQKGMDEMAELLLPYSFELSDFQKIMASLPSDEERKKYRTNFLSKTRAKSRSGHLVASQFLFQLFWEEKQYNKIMNEINDYTPYSLLLQYFDILIRHDRKSFLDILLRLDIDGARYAKENSTRQDQEENRERLLERITSNLNKSEIALIHHQSSLKNDRFFVRTSTIQNVLLKRLLKENQ